MQLVIFDVDGTLTRTTRVDATCFVRAIADEFGIAVKPTWADYTYSTDPGIALEIVEKERGRRPSADELDRFQRRLLALLRESLVTSPEQYIEVAGARAALQHLQHTPDWAVAIATGSWQTSALLKLQAAHFDVAGIPAAFAEDGLSRDEIVRAAIIRAEAPRAGASFSRMVYVGDAVWDVRAASRLQLPFVGIGSERRVTALRHAGATHVVRDLTDIDRLLRSLQEAEVPHE